MKILIYRHKKILFRIILLSFLIILTLLFGLSVKSKGTSQTYTAPHHAQKQKAVNYLKEKQINLSYFPIPFVSINVHVDGHTKKYSVPFGSVKSTLEILNIKYNENDIIDCSEDSYIYANQTINIHRVEEKTHSTISASVYETRIIASDKMLTGEKRIIQEGSFGREKIIYRDFYVDGQIVHSAVKDKIEIKKPVTEIIQIGTKSILVNDISYNQEKNNRVLLKTNVDNPSFSLPKVNLSDKDRDLLERLLTGEFGSSYIGSCLVAQAIKCAIVYDGYTSIENLIYGMGYVGSTNIGKTQNAVDAVEFIFDENELAVNHRLFYMCTEDYYKSDPGNFHSTQNFILQYENVLFFDRW